MVFIVVKFFTNIQIKLIVINKTLCERIEGVFNMGFFPLSALIDISHDIKTKVYIQIVPVNVVIHRHHK